MSEPTSPDAEQLAQQYRQAIREADARLLRLAESRVALHVELAKLRTDGAQPLVDEIHDALKSVELPEGMDHGEARRLLREVIGWCHEKSRPTRAAYLGPAYSYSHLAALERFSDWAELVPVASVAAVFAEVVQGDCQFGVAPLENSTDGRVVDTLDMFSRCPIQICGEVQLRIRHCLLGRGARDQIAQVFSKPQALSQCRDWLASHLPEARLVEMASTTDAASRAAVDPTTAAIASATAASHYGLDVLASDIQDQHDNVTRFAILGSQASPPSGHDKTAIMFQVPHQPGALVEAMSVFHRNHLNMTWIESFPCRSTPQEYLFFVEIQGHQQQVSVQQALAELRQSTIRLEVLGSYAVSQPT